jgi:hypothetical protein
LRSKQRNTQDDWKERKQVSQFGLIIKGGEGKRKERKRRREIISNQVFHLVDEGSSIKISNEPEARIAFLAELVDDPIGAFIVHLSVSIVLLFGIDDQRQQKQVSDQERGERRRSQNLVGEKPQFELVLVKAVSKGSEGEMIVFLKDEDQRVEDHRSRSKSGSNEKGCQEEGGDECHSLLASPVVVLRKAE